MPKLTTFLCLFYLLVSIETLSAQIQSDFDADGTSDICAVTSNGSTLSWSALGSTSQTEEFGDSFGLPNDAIVMAHWIDSGEINRGVVRPDSDNKNLVWRILSSTSDRLEKKSFGKPGDVIMSGADFDGNGISDAAVVRPQKSGKLLWIVKLNFFADTKVKQVHFTLGKVGDRVLYFNPDGSKDYAAVFGKASNGRSELQWRSVSSRKVRKSSHYRPALTNEPRPRPFPIQVLNGSDVLGISTADETETTLEIFTPRGKRIAHPTFPGLGSFIVGNFANDSSGEEVAFQTSSKITIYRPSDDKTESATFVSGTLIDEIQVVAVEASLTPTPTATATATPTPTATRTATPTSTPTPVT